MRMPLIRSCSSRMGEATPSHPIASAPATPTSWPWAGSLAAIGPRSSVAGSSAPPRRREKRAARPPGTRAFCGAAGSANAGQVTHDTAWISAASVTASSKQVAHSRFMAHREAERDMDVTK